MLLQPNNNKFGLYKEKTGLKLLPPQEGLICNLDMEKIVGTTIYDRTGNGRNFTSYNSPSLISGVKGLNRGLSYNGTNQYSNGGNFSLFDYDTFTLEHWIYYETGKYCTLCCGDSNSPGSNTNMFSIQVFNDKIIARTVDFGNAYALNYAISPVKYYHIVYQIIGRTFLRLYVNGENVGEETVVYPRENSSGYRKIDINMIRRTESSDVYYNGNCLLFRVWDRTLSAKEVKYLYNNGYGIK